MAGCPSLSEASAEARHRPSRASCSGPSRLTTLSAYGLPTAPRSPIFMTLPSSSVPRISSTRNFIPASLGRSAVFDIDIPPVPAPLPGPTLTRADSKHDLVYHVSPLTATVASRRDGHKG